MSRRVAVITLSRLELANGLKNDQVANDPGTRVAKGSRIVLRGSVHLQGKLVTACNKKSQGVHIAISAMPFGHGCCGCEDSIVAKT
eukprot:5144410-Amphidinium_carterae.1